MRDRPRNQGFAAAGGTVEQDPLGRVDSEPGEHLRITQRQFNDLADAPDFPPKSADVLVGQGGSPDRMLSGLRAHGPHCQQRCRRDEDRPFGRRLPHEKVQIAAPEQGAPYPISFHHRQAIQPGADVLEIAIRGDRDGGRQDDPLSGLGDHFAHRHDIVQCHPRIAPRKPIQLDRGSRPSILVRRHHFADRAALTRNLHDTADLGPQRLDIGRVHPRQRPSHVLAQPLGHFQAQRTICRFVHS